MHNRIFYQPIWWVKSYRGSLPQGKRSPGRTPLCSSPGWSGMWHHTSFRIRCRFCLHCTALGRCWQSASPRPDHAEHTREHSSWKLCIHTGWSLHGKTVHRHRCQICIVRCTWLAPRGCCTSWKLLWSIIITLIVPLPYCRDHHDWLLNSPRTRFWQVLLAICSSWELVAQAPREAVVSEVTSWHSALVFQALMKSAVVFMFSPSKVMVSSCKLPLKFPPRPVTYEIWPFDIH